MSLTRKQKKYIKRNVKKKTFGEIAAHLEVSVEELNKYLENRWGKEKYQRFLVEKKSRPRADSKQRALSSNLRGWFVKNYQILALLALLVFAAYVNAINNGFVSDDIGGILENPYLDSAKYVFSNPFSFFNLFIRYSIFKIFGRTPTFYRIFNIFSHLGSTLAIYLLLQLLNLNRKVAFFAASIFAVHPILTESVTWISGGYYSHSAFLVLLSFCLYILSSKDKKVSFYVLSILLYFLALATSEKVIAFPIILFVYEICFGKLKKNWKKIVPFLMLNAIWAFYLLGAFSARVASLEKEFYQKPSQTDNLSQLATNFLQRTPIAVTSYLELIFWPKNLTLYHSEMTFSQGEYLLRLLIFVTFLSVIAYAYKKNRHVFFWLSFFIISLLPMLTPFGISWVVAERYVYLGSVGIFVVVALGIKKLNEIKEMKNIPLVFFGLVILALMARTISRNADWKNEDTLWLAAAKTSPSSPQNHNNLGDLYSRRGDLEKAVSEFKKAIELEPNYGDAYHNLANTYRQMGKEGLAIENYQKALSLNPNLWQSYQSLAAIFFDQGQVELAAENTKRAVEISPQDASLHFNLGIIYLKLERKEEAKASLQKALELDPQNQRTKQILLSL